MAYYLGKNSGITDTLFGMASNVGDPISTLLNKNKTGSGEATTQASTTTPIGSSTEPGICMSECMKKYTDPIQRSACIKKCSAVNIKCKACVNDKLVTMDSSTGGDCPTGWVPATSGALPCESGPGPTCESKCIQNYTDPTERAACIKNCVVITPCKTDADCTNGKCVDGKCVTNPPPPPPGECGIGIDKKGGGLRNITADCPCGDGFYRAKETDACPSGYRTLGVGEDARCECDSYVPPGDTTTQMGEFQWPPELLALMSSLTNRAGQYLDKRPGYSDSILRTLLGQNYDAVRRAGTLTRNSTLADLQSGGMLDTGPGAGQLAAGATATDQALADARRNVIMANEAKKTSDLSDFTKMASDLTGQQVGIQQVLEAINAARRGEGRSDLALMLQYLMSLLSSWKTA